MGPWPRKTRSEYGEKGWSQLGQMLEKWSPVKGCTAEIDGGHNNRIFVAICLLGQDSVHSAIRAGKTMLRYI